MDCMGAAGGIFCSKSALVYSILAVLGPVVALEVASVYPLATSAAQLASSRLQ